MNSVYQIRRLNTIVNKVRYNPGISKELIIEAVIETTDKPYSLRTFYRDLKHLTEDLKYFIYYDSKSEGYFLDAIQPIPNEDGFINKSLSVIDTHNALTELDANQDFIHLSMDKSDLLNPSLNTIIQSLRRQRKLFIDYHKINSNSCEEYEVSPLMLKEYEHTWYLMADHDGVIKAFTIRGIKNLELLEDKSNLNLISECRDKLDTALGVSFLNNKPEFIRLVTTKQQAEYLKSYPIHQSQEVLEKNDEVVIFQLRLIVNNELIMKVLSFRGAVKVMSPLTLYEKVVAMVAAMSNNLELSKINLRTAHKMFMS